MWQRRPRTHHTTSNSLITIQIIPVINSCAEKHAIEPTKSTIKKDQNGSTHTHTVIVLNHVSLALLLSAPSPFAIDECIGATLKPRCCLLGLMLLRMILDWLDISSDTNTISLQHSAH